MKDFIEQQIIGAVRSILARRINEILTNVEFLVPLVEYGKYESGSIVVSVIGLSTCKRNGNYFVTPTPPWKRL
jgi:hypothetical protein